MSDRHHQTARALRLLWDPTPGDGARGPRRGLTRDLLTAAAIEICDARGLGALTMRSLADRLAVAPATLYTYVPGRFELLAIVLDQMIGQSSPPGPASSWRDRLTATAAADFEQFRRRPWLLELVSAQPVIMGPGLLAWYEASLVALADSPIPPADRVAALESVDAFVRGSALAAVDHARQHADPAADTQAAFLSARVDWSAYPAFVAIDAAGALDDPERHFRYGLERLLDGIAGRLSEDDDRDAPIRRTARA